MMTRAFMNDCSSHMIAGRFSFHGNCVVEPRSEFKVVGLRNLTRYGATGVNHEKGGQIFTVKRKRSRGFEC